MNKVLLLSKADHFSKKVTDDGWVRCFCPEKLLTPCLEIWTGDLTTLERTLYYYNPQTLHKFENKIDTQTNWRFSRILVLFNWLLKIILPDTALRIFWSFKGMYRVYFRCITSASMGETRKTACRYKTRKTLCWLNISNCYLCVCTPPVWEAYTKNVFLENDSAHRKRGVLYYIQRKKFLNKF